MSAVIENNLIQTYDDVVHILVLDQQDSWRTIITAPVELRIINPDPIRPWHTIISVVAKDVLLFEVPTWAKIPVKLYANIGFIAAQMLPHTIIGVFDTVHIAKVGEIVMDMELNK